MPCRYVSDVAFGLSEEVGYVFYRGLHPDVLAQETIERIQVGDGDFVVLDFVPNEIYQFQQKLFHDWICLVPHIYVHAVSGTSAFGYRHPAEYAYDFLQLFNRLRRIGFYARQA